MSGVGDSGILGGIFSFIPQAVQAIGSNVPTIAASFGDKNAQAQVAAQQALQAQQLQAQAAVAVAPYQAQIATANASMYGEIAIGLGLLGGAIALGYALTRGRG